MQSTFCAPTFSFEEALTIADYPLFFIRVKCLCGSRHYSENMTHEDACAIMSKYIAVAEYFGGGIVELCDWNGDVIREKVVIDY